MISLIILVLRSIPRIFLLTAVVAVDKLVTIALCLADLIALFAVVEAGIVLILVVSRWWWGWFRRTGNGNIASRAYATTSDRSAGSVMIVRCAVLSVLRSVLVFLGSAISRIIVFGRENVVSAAAASLRWYSWITAILTRLWKKLATILAIIADRKNIIYKVKIVFKKYIKQSKTYLYCLIKYAYEKDLRYHRLRSRTAVSRSVSRMSYRWSHGARMAVSWMGEGLELHSLARIHFLTESQKMERSIRADLILHACK